MRLFLIGKKYEGYGIIIDVLIDKNDFSMVFYVSDYENRERVPACSFGC